mmetsp:Transcript_21751/g.42272  ORF Transcript_21751/g.42272 Transcript_21751/m.42272 type:complete len:254 (+) Transcript_21751:2083-2844(+)
MSWRRDCTDRDLFGNCLASRGFCFHDNALSFLVPLACVHMAAMIFALYVCYLCRNLPQSYAESRWITTAIFSNLQILVLGGLLLVLLHDDPVPFYIMKVIIVFLNEASILYCIFMPKIMAVYLKSNVSESAKKVLDVMENDMKRKQEKAMSALRKKKSKSSKEKSNSSYKVKRQENQRNPYSFGVVKNVNIADPLASPRKGGTPYASVHSDGDDEQSNIKDSKNDQSPDSSPREGVRKYQPRMPREAKKAGPH